MLKLLTKFWVVELNVVKHMVSVRILEWHLTVLTTCRLPDQVQSSGAVSLVITDSHFNLSIGVCMAHVAKHAPPPSVLMSFKRMMLHSGDTA